MRSHTSPLRTHYRTEIKVSTPLASGANRREMAAGFRLEDAGLNRTLTLQNQHRIQPLRGSFIQIVGEIGFALQSSVHRLNRRLESGLSGVSGVSGVRKRWHCTF